MKRRFRNVFLIVAGIILVTLFITYSGNKNQPIAFNHKKHTENNIRCIECHPFFENSARAGIPNVKVCTRCHEDVIYLSLEKRKLLSYVASRQRIPWFRVYTVPDHVLFSHQRHVIAGRLKCAECHGAIAEMIDPIIDRARELSMKDCISCHAGVYRNPNECISCHR